MDKRKITGVDEIQSDKQGVAYGKQPLQHLLVILFEEKIKRQDRQQNEQAVRHRDAEAIEPQPVKTGEQETAKTRTREIIFVDEKKGEAANKVGKVNKGDSFKQDL